MTRLLLVDDQPLIRAGLRGILEHEHDLEVIGEASQGDEALELARLLRPDVLVMDLRMPVMDGVEATRRLRADAALTDTRVLVLTTFDADREVIAAMSAGADGFLSKGALPAELLAAVRAVATGEVALPQQALRALLGAFTSTGPAGSSPVDPVLVDRIALLTEREREVVIAASTGDDNDTIARTLFISPYTVKTHLNRAMAKLGARDRGQLVAIAHRAGLLPS